MPLLIVALIRIQFCDLFGPRPLHLTIGLFFELFPFFDKRRCDIRVNTRPKVFPAAQIGGELEKLPENRVPERSDWAKLSANWGRRIDEHIAELQRLRAGVGECIGCGCLSLDRCRLANPGDRAGRRGAGARYWMGDPQP
jgi:redox-sensitive transcriptional activator SoxR